MSRPRETLSGWAFTEECEQPTSLRSPQERNLLQFSPFAGMEEGPPTITGRFRRVMTTVSGSNGPRDLTNLTSRQLSQMSSNDSGDGACPMIPGQNHDKLTSDDGNEAKGQDPNDNGDIEAPWKAHSAAKRIGNDVSANSLTISLDQATLRGKPLSPRSGRRRVISDAERTLDMDASRVSAQSKLDTSDQNSAQSMGVAETEGGVSGTAVVRGVAALTKKLSQDGKMIRKISGLLSLTNPVSRRRSQPEFKVNTDDECLDDLKTEDGIPKRKGSLVGILGRKEKLPQRKRSFLRSLKGAGRNRSKDCQAQTEESRGLGAEVRESDRGHGAKGEDEKVTAAIGGFGSERDDDDDDAITEDDLAKRAVEIEKFLNEVAFL